jgi:hypothetical protein
MNSSWGSTTSDSNLGAFKRPVRTAGPLSCKRLCLCASMIVRI